MVSIFFRRGYNSQQGGADTTASRRVLQNLKIFQQGGGAPRPIIGWGEAPV